MLLLSIGSALQDWFSSIGMTEGFGLFFVSFVAILGIVVLTIILGGSYSIAMLLGIIGLFVVTAFGWVPEWIVFILGLLFFGYAFLKVRGGNSL